MAYSAHADVAAEFKATTFSSSSLITSTQVTEFIAQADALIDSYVGMKYIVPVTAGASALKLLKLFSAVLTADRVRKILEVKQATNKDADQNPRGMSPVDVMKQLKDIRDGNLLLDGATSLIGSGGFYSNNEANNVTPVMRKDDKQW